MTRTFATARKTLTLRVAGLRVETKAARGKAKPTRMTVTFPTRYALRRYLGRKVAAAVKVGYVPV